VAGYVTMVVVVMVGTFMLVATLLALRSSVL